MSNAMDVGNPSNMNRIMDLYKTLNNLKKDMNSWSFNEEETIESILKIFNNYNYLLDPHSAIGLLGLERYLKEFNNDVNSIFLGTAHPAKFADILEPIINKKIIFPESLLRVMNKNKKSKVLKNDYKEFYDYLIDTFQ